MVDEEDAPRVDDEEPDGKWDDGGRGTARLAANEHKTCRPNNSATFWPYGTRHSIRNPKRSMNGRFGHRIEQRNNSRARFVSQIHHRLLNRRFMNEERGRNDERWNRGAINCPEFVDVKRRKVSSLWSVAFSLSITPVRRKECQAFSCSSTSIRLATAGARPLVVFFEVRPHPHARQTTRCVCSTTTL